MKLNSQYIQSDLAVQRALSLHQVAILDFLNSAQKVTDISQRVIVDDPNLNESGYSIGETVAQHILDKRDELGGFTSLHQLQEISYFGPDKFHDLVYTFVSLRLPLPSGRGQQFDEFLAAVGALELDAINKGMATADFLTALRKLFFDQTTDIEGSISQNWELMIPSANGDPPARWANKGLTDAVNFIRETAEVKIDGINVNLHQLIAGMDVALRKPQAVQLLDGQIGLPDNLSGSTYLNRIGTASFRYLIENGITFEHDPPFEGKLLEHAFFKDMTIGDFYASADAFAMKFVPERSVVWNILHYYSEKEGPIQHRFTPLVEHLGLGSLKSGGGFSGDSVSLREQIRGEILASSINIGQLNGRKGEELDVYLEDDDSSPIAKGYHTITTWATDMFIDVLESVVSMQENKPAILTWNRLEGRPRTQDFVKPLYAEVRDPLWYLCRQYQMGEFKGEDTGSAIEMRVKMNKTRINQFAPRRYNARPYQEEIPLETIVERQSTSIDLLSRMEMAHKWEELLFTHAKGQNLAQPSLKTLLSDFREEASFAFDSVATGDSSVRSDLTRLSTQHLAQQSKLLDGYKLYESLAAGAVPSDFTSVSLPNLDELGRIFVSWVKEKLLAQYQANDSSWNPAHLEYQFACSAPEDSNSSAVLIADEYATGELDWYNFDFVHAQTDFDNDLQPANPDVSLIEEDIFTMIPSSLTYPGMPLPRWWQMEDYQINYEKLVINKSDSASLAFAEFITLYSNDWMVIPYGVEVGQICHIQSLIVKDVFGQYTSVQPSGAGDNTDWQRWSIFNLNRRGFTSGAADTRLFIPPTLPRFLESEPIEKVHFLRDEMANMVWGVEATIPDGAWGGTDGYEAGIRLFNHLLNQAGTPPPSTLIENDAQLVYKLGNTVPENWIPFVPVRLGGTNSRQIQLQRAAMPRIIEGLASERVRPRTELLRENYDAGTGLYHPYYIFEEEIPRSGSVVSKSWQRSRWYQGKVIWWLGNRKLNGRGQVNSGLAFDQLLPKE